MIGLHHERELLQGLPRIRGSSSDGNPFINNIACASGDERALGPPTSNTLFDHNNNNKHRRCLSVGSAGKSGWLHGRCTVLRSVPCHAVGSRVCGYINRTTMTTAGLPVCCETLVGYMGANASCIEGMCLWLNVFLPVAGLPLQAHTVAHRPHLPQICWRHLVVIKANDRTARA